MVSFILDISRPRTTSSRSRKDMDPRNRSETQRKERRQKRSDDKDGAGPLFHLGVLLLLGRPIKILALLFIFFPSIPEVPSLQGSPGAKSDHH